MLIAASWIETLREILGIEAVSQVWGNRPAWYFWVSDAAGVYHLTVESTRTENVRAASVHSAVLSLRYYPFDRQEMFALFSFEEQCYIRSGFFDGTNTPFHEHRDKIPKHLFHVAALEFTVDEDDTFALFTFESLDLLRLTYRQAADRSYPALKQRKRFEKGSVDRRIPGVAVAYPFFDLLLCLHAHASKRKPSRVTITREPGFETVNDPSGNPTCVDTPDIPLSTVNVLFTDRAIPPGQDLPAALMDPHRQKNASVILDRSFVCGHLHDGDLASPPSTPLNRRWWTLAEDGIHVGAVLGLRLLLAQRNITDLWRTCAPIALLCIRRLSAVTPYGTDTRCS